MSASANFTNLTELWHKSCEIYRDRQLFGVKSATGWKWQTYGDVGEAVDACRGGLAELGISEGDRVAVIADNRPEWAAAAYATYGRKATYVPMYQAQKAEEWQFILNDCEAVAVFCATPEIHQTLRKMAGGDCPKLQHVIGFDLPADHEDSWQTLLNHGKDKPAEPEYPDSDHLAGFIYTSGTTGNPKGVMLSHGNITSNVNAVHEIFPLDSDDRSLSFLPWAHAFGQTCELHTLVSLGASLGLNDEIPNLLPNLAEVKPSVLYAVPRIFSRIYDGVNAQVKAKPAFIQKLVARGIAAANRKSEGGSLGLFDKIALALSEKLVFAKIRARFGGRLKYAISGSAALSTEVAKFIDALGIMVYEGYGLSETSPIATANYPNNRRVGSVGKAIPQVSIIIDKSATDDDKQGEIIIKGPNIMKGYHNRPEEQAKVFTEDGGLRTGDTGWLDDDGYLFIRGRIKEQYKLENGKYVMPAPLEEQLKLSPYIGHVMLDGANRPFNIAVIAPEHAAVKKWAREEGVSLGKLSEDEKLRQLVEKELEELGKKFKGYERPKKIVIVDDEFTTDNGLLTPTLKLKRAKVVAKYQAEIDKLYD